MAYTGYAHLGIDGIVPSAEITSSPTGVVPVLSTTSNIDLKTAAATNLYTVPAGKTLIVTEIVLRVTAASGFAAGCTLSIGKSAAYTEWLAATAMTGLSAIGNYRLLSNSAAGLVYNVFAAGDVIALNVTIGATATTLTATAELQGYLI